MQQLYSGFYSLRFPRPIITNLFLFLFLFFSIKFYISEFKKDSGEFILDNNGNYARINTQKLGLNMKTHTTHLTTEVIAPITQSITLRCS